MKFRYFHSCAHIHSDGTGLQFSIIVAGGYILQTVEILDQAADAWHNGPQLPIKISESAIVEDPLGKFLPNNCFVFFVYKFLGIHQTIQKNSVGFIPWDEITVGKHRIPWEKHRQSVLFYAPTPKTH